MSRGSRITSSLVAVGAAISIAAPGAAADGLPVPFDGGDNTGVSNPETGYSYSTVSGPGETTVAVKIAKGTGEIQRTTNLRGDYGVPLVAYDATPSGLSADGETLVLWNPRRGFPRETTRFAVLETEQLKLREVVTLDGDFSFDALSPDGSTVYLIRYTDPRDPTAYEVRAYDIDRGRLLAEPIIDPNEVGEEEMAGFPQTRATSPDGRWEYTLYEPAGNDHPPFIHALDAERATAVCIDLDLLADHRQVWRLDLTPSPGGETLEIVDRGEPLASVDLSSFEVSAAALEPAAAASAAESDDGGGGGAPWIAATIAGAGTLLAGAALVARRRRRAGDRLALGH